METQSVSLVDILEQCQIRANVFFRFLQHFLQGLSLSEIYQQKRKALEKKYVIGSILIKKFNDIYPQFLYYRPNVSESTSIYKFTWTLFLVIREKLLPRPDLLNSFHLLLCCIDLAYIHSKETFKVANVTSEDIQGTGHILGFLCQTSNASTYDVQLFHDSAFMPFLKSNLQSLSYQRDENANPQP